MGDHVGILSVVLFPSFCILHFVVVVVVVVVVVKNILQVAFLRSRCTLCHDILTNYIVPCLVGRLSLCYN